MVLLVLYGDVFCFLVGAGLCEPRTAGFVHAGRMWSLATASNGPQHPPKPGAGLLSACVLCLLQHVVKHSKSKILLPSYSKGVALINCL